MRKTLPIQVSMILIVSFVFIPSAVSQEADYVGNSQCKVCHNKKADGEQWNKWKAMKHSHAFEALSSDAAAKVAADLGLTTPPAETARCLECHVTAYDAEKAAPPAKIKLADSVQCESCHGPASLHLKDGKELKFSKGKSDIDVLANIVRPNNETCLQCHNDRNPTWDPEKYTLADGGKSGFDFEQALAEIAHPNPTKAK